MLKLEYKVEFLNRITGKVEEVRIGRVKGEVRMELLRKIFTYYNSDDHNARRSMSVGDIVTIEGVMYQCSMEGWRKIK